MPEPFTGPERIGQERNTLMATARPVSCEADGSLAGEAALVRPASPEALNMAHASLTADMAVLHAILKEFRYSLSTDLAEIRQQLSNLSNLVVEAIVSTSARSTPLSGNDAQAMPVITHRHSPAQTTTSILRRSSLFLSQPPSPCHTHRLHNRPAQPCRLQ